jgi:hypothetical protein
MRREGERVEERERSEGGWKWRDGEVAGWEVCGIGGGIGPEKIYG